VGCGWAWLGYVLEKKMSDETNLQPPEGIANEFIDDPKDAG
jgi:hypothetical protein